MVRVSSGRSPSRSSSLSRSLAQRTLALATDTLAYPRRYPTRKEGSPGKKTDEGRQDSFRKRKVLKPPPAALDDQGVTEHWQIGRFSGGKLTGSGMMRMPDGAYYFGDFKEGKRHGAGMSVSGMSDEMRRQIGCISPAKVASGRAFCMFLVAPVAASSPAPSCYPIWHVPALVCASSRAAS